MASSGRSANGALVVRFDDREWLVAPGATKVAGRGAHLDLGSDPEIHRKVAAFASVGGCWFVVNLMGPPKRITVAGRDTGGAGPRFVSDESELPPGRLRLSFRIGTVMRHIDVDVPERSLDTSEVQALKTGTETKASAPRFEISPAQRRLAVALAELRLLDPTSTSPLPTKAEVCDRLQWSEKQYDNHLDALCRKLHMGGVEGVVGEGTKKATQRREIAVDVLLEGRIIDFDDLVLLPAD